MQVNWAKRHGDGAEEDDVFFFSSNLWWEMEVLEDERPS